MSSCRNLDSDEIITIIVNRDYSKAQSLAPFTAKNIQQLYILLKALYSTTEETPINQISVELGHKDSLPRKLLYRFNFVNGDMSEGKAFDKVKQAPPEPPVYFRVVVEGNNVDKFEEVPDLYMLADDKAFFELPLTSEECNGVRKFLAFLAEHDIYKKVHNVVNITPMPVVKDYEKAKEDAKAFEKEVENAIAEATL